MNCMHVSQMVAETLRSMNRTAMNMEEEKIKALNCNQKKKKLKEQIEEESCMKHRHRLTVTESSVIIT